MSGVIMAIVVLCAIGAACALLLVIASKYMSVPENERFPVIRECLAGANCGACGYAGCDGYANALAEGTETRTNLCTPGGNGAATAIAAVLGVEVEDVPPKVAFVACAGDCEKAQHKYEYAGVNTCAGANSLFAGEWACPSSCLGYGDCEKVCPEDAIHLRNGVAYVDYGKCIGCGLCARQCPKRIISLRETTNRVVVRCSSTEVGAAVRKACSTCCIGCKKCEKTCEHDAIHVVNNLAQIDYGKCVNCGMCVESCPMHVLVKL